MLGCVSGGFGLGRFSQAKEKPFTGLVTEAGVVRACDILEAPEAACDVLTLLEDWDRSFDRLVEGLERRKGLLAPTALTSLRAHAPVAQPRQLFCTGANYARHVVDMVVAMGAAPATDGMDADQRRDWARGLVARQRQGGNPFVFMKPTTSVAGPFDDLVIPAGVAKLDWELELGVVMGRAVHAVSRQEAWSAIAGYMVVNDITARERLARPDAPGLGADWLSAKGGPGYLPSGPFFVPRQFVPEPEQLHMRLWVNGELKQDDDPRDMIFPIDHQVEFIASRAQMAPGDILCTGSPTGNGIIEGLFLKPGDVIEATIEGLGTQSVRCVAPQ